MNARLRLSPRPRRVPLASAVAAVLLAACSAAATSAPATPAPAGSPTPAPTRPVAAPTPVILPAPTAVPTAVPAAAPSLVIPPVTAADAAAIVGAANPALDGIGPLDPNMIGASAWYEARSFDGTWQLTYTVGWGDCQAGCISRHTWTYSVSGAGVATLLSEGGDPLEGGGGNGGGIVPDPGSGAVVVPVPAGAGPWLIGHVGFGPTCPVVSNPPDPACLDRPVAGASIAVLDAAGSEVGRATTDAAGIYAVKLPAGGTYTAKADPVEGLMGTPAAVEFTVDTGPAASTRVDLSYDTGIR